MAGDELTYDLPDSVAHALRALTDAGHEVALVGGTVRDRLRVGAVGPGAWDAATSAHPEQVSALFPGSTWKNRFGTVTVEGSPALEITSYRAEGSYRDRRRPDEVRFGVSLGDDLARRDFTLNAVAWVPTDVDAGRGRIVDPFGGRADLEARRLRTVGDPAERFGEDALRLIRAARFAGRFEMTVDPATEAAVHELAPTVASVSAERLRDELLRILRSDEPPSRDAPPSRGLRELERLGLMAVVLPEVAALRQIPQAKARPGDALDHTLAAVDAAPLDAEIRLAALLHDVGKATTRADGHFIGHERVGARLADAILRRLRMPSAAVDRIVHAIRHHMYAYDDSWTDAAVRRFVRRLEPHGTTLLFALRRADNAASGVGSSADTAQERLERRIADELARQPDLLTAGRLAIDGHDLQRELGLRPGPRIGDLLDRLTELVLDEPERNERGTLLAIARALAGQR